jgi:acyl-CoA thioester hydrolase
MKHPSSSAIYYKGFTVPESAVDQNRHVNNVAYVQWMQDVAIQHADAVGAPGPLMPSVQPRWFIHTKLNT